MVPVSCLEIKNKIKNNNEVEKNENDEKDKEWKESEDDEDDNEVNLEKGDFFNFEGGIVIQLRDRFEKEISESMNDEVSKENLKNHWRDGLSELSGGQVFFFFNLIFFL
jgi:hypothetical protein